MNTDKLIELENEVLPLCDDLNGSPSHLHEWMMAGNKDGVFDGMSAAQVAEMWNKQMEEYRNEQQERGEY